MPDPLCEPWGSPSVLGQANWRRQPDSNRRMTVLQSVSENANALSAQGDSQGAGICNGSCKDIPQELGRVIEAWDQLPEAVKAGILAMVKASSSG